MTLIAQGSYTIKRSAKNGKDAGVNLLKWQEEWTLGSDVLPNWNNNGAVAENERIIWNNPFGIKSIIWKCKEQGDSGGSGGWDGSYMSLDPKFAYRYCVFVYKTKDSGTLYHGTNGILTMDGVIKENPFFYAGGLPIGEWHLVVGIIHPNSATVDSGTSGLYNMSGKKIYGGTDYKQRNPSVKVNFRSYNFYDSDTQQSQYFYNPMLHRMDGTEPSIEQILQLSVRKEIDAAKATSEAYAAAQAELARTKAEANADGKITAAEARAIADATNKANAARDAAITAAAADASAKIDAVKTTYDNKFESTDKQFLSVLSETKTYADNAVNNVQIGGRNLLRNTIDEISSVRNFNHALAYPITKGEFYTYSVLLKANRATQASVYLNDDLGLQKAGITFGSIQLTTEYKKYELTAKASLGDGVTVPHIMMRVYGREGDTITGKEGKLEKGNKATDWTPAPEDVSEDAQAYADKVAKKAADAAATAQAKADSASLDASKANSRLADWASDSYISPTEKVAMRQLQVQITNDRLALCEQAGQYIVDSSTFVSAYNNYNTQLTNHTATTPENIQISALLSSTQLAYNNARIALTKAIAVAAKVDAQTKADKAKSDAIAQAQTDAAKNYPTKTEFKSSIDQLAGQISSKVSQTDYNALGERVKKAETEILQTPEAINLAVRKIAVGTRNYVSHSKYNIQENVSNVRGWGVRGWKLVDDNIFNKVLRVEADGAYIVFNRNDFKCGDYVTISLTIKGERDGSFSSQISDGNGGNRWGDGIFSYTKEWQRVSVTIKIPQGITVDSDQNFYYYPSAPVLIADVTINKGNVAAAWQLADEEMLNKDNILSSINLSEEGVKIDGKKVEITGELLAQIIKAKGLNVGDKTFIDSLGNFKTVNGTFSGKMNATSGSIGNFSITDGDIIGLDTNKKERIRVSTSPLPAISDLFTGYSLISPELNLEYEDYFQLDSDSYVERNQIVCSFRRTIHLDASTTIIINGSGAMYSSRLRGGGVDRFKGATRYEEINLYNSSNQLIAKSDWDRPVDLPAGDITIEVVSRFVAVGMNTWVDPSVYEMTIYTGWRGILARGTTEKTYIGSDGFYSVFGSGEYVYFKRGVGFVTKGKTDMSGVLASGTVAANGTQTNVWGARAADGFVTKGGVGIFNVPHNIGHTKYTVMASSYNNGITVAIVSKSPYSVQLHVGANGSSYDIGFDYTIIGQN